MGDAQTVRDTDLLGYYVPKGTNVIAYPGHEPPAAGTLDDPMKFDPDRFTEPRNEHKRHRYAYSPFGGGAHKCIGMTFGQLEVKTILHRLLRRYRLELAAARLPSRVGTTAACPPDGRDADSPASAVGRDDGPISKPESRLLTAKASAARARRKTSPSPFAPDWTPPRRRTAWACDTTSRCR